MKSSGDTCWWKPFSFLVWFYLTLTGNVRYFYFSIKKIVFEVKCKTPKKSLCLSYHLLLPPFTTTFSIFSNTFASTFPSHRCVLHATILNSRAEAYGNMLEGDVIAEMTLHNPQLVKVINLPTLFMCLLHYFIFFFSCHSLLFFL